MSGVRSNSGARGKSRCYNCSKRRIKCDGTKPQCEKCLRKGLECPGYGVRYRFNQDIVPRGKAPQPICPVDSMQLGPDTPENQPLMSLLWPDGSRTSTREPVFSNPAIFELDDQVMDENYAVNPAFGTVDGLGLSLAPSINESEGWVPGYTDVPAPRPDTGEMIPMYGACSASQGVLGYDFSLRVPSSLELVDSRTRELFDHFSSTIAPVMVVVDSTFNGYRNLLLPLACEDELVKAAVCVASLDLLAQQQPELQRRAELGFQSILKQLRRRASNLGNLVDVSAWATTIILLTAETVTGGTNLPYLFKILRHLADANSQDGRYSAMHAFLAEQTRMMSLFAQPLVEESTGAIALSHRSEAYLDFVSNMAIFRPELSEELEIYKTAIHSACNIYVARATIDPPHCDTIPDLDRLKALCELINPSTPGHHTLVWVFFIAAAESSTFEHRQFFTTRLQEIFARTRFQNIPVALAALQEMWKVQSKRRWTEVLPEVMPVFII